MKKRQKIILGIFLFVLFFVLLFLFGWDNTDNIWNYGGAHAIRMGELPYLDFNLVTTPMYHFLMSSFLWIHDSYFTFLVEQSLLCVFLFFLLEKMVSHKVWILFPILLFPIFYFIFPNYNFLVLLLLFLILYLDKNEKSDSIIGICLGLIILTKHTVGGVVFLMSLISARRFSKIKKRVCFSFIPLSIFLIYLLISKTFTNFFDLALLGLFDFAGSNSYFSLFFTSIAVIYVCYTIYSFIRYKGDITNYYLVAAISFLIPIVDMFHSVYLIGFFITILFMRLSFDDLKKSVVLGSSIFLTIVFLNLFIGWDIYRNLAFVKRDYLTFNIADKNRSQYIDHVLSKYREYPNSVMISINSMYFDIESGKKITFFDIPLYGNFGYHGLERMKEKIKKMDDTYFFILDNDDRQFAIELNEYVRKHSVFVEKVEDVEVYYKEK